MRIFPCEILILSIFLFSEIFDIINFWSSSRPPLLRCCFRLLVLLLAITSADYDVSLFLWAFQYLLVDSSHCFFSGATPDFHPLILPEIIHLWLMIRHGQWYVFFSNRCPVISVGSYPYPSRFLVISCHGYPGHIRFLRKNFYYPQKIVLSIKTSKISCVSKSIYKFQNFYFSKFT